MSSEREKQIIEQTAETLKKFLGVQKIWLFGSRANGQARQGSDFDFAVDQKRPDVRIEAELEKQLERVRGLHEIDLIYLESVDADFRDHVLKTGKVIYERAS